MIHTLIAILILGPIIVSTFVAIALFKTAEHQRYDVAERASFLHADRFGR